MSLQNRQQTVQTGRGPLPWLIDLSEFLHCQEYAAAETNAILISVLDHGTLQVAVDRQHLDPEDYATAEQIYTDSQPAVPPEDPAWDDADRWELGPAIPPGTVLVPPELDDDEDLYQLPQGCRQVKPDWKNWESWVNSGVIKPISGGAPVSGPIGSAGDVLNVLVPALEGAGFVICPESVSEEGLSAVQGEIELHIDFEMRGAPRFCPTKTQQEFAARQAWRRSPSVHPVRARQEFLAQQCVPGLRSDDLPY